MSSEGVNMENNRKTAFTKLLNRLQEDSWQLELLISAFAIFGLFYALEPVAKAVNVAQFDNNLVFISFLIIAYFSLQILIFNLLLHLLLRAIWIGSLGLRYVFGDINFDQLNYSEQFTNYLKKKIGSFDTYISKLENFCSVIFAITFLLVFYIFSFFIIASLIIAFQNSVPDWMVVITRVLFILFSIGILLTFIDFISLGLLKKNKWVAKIYFPFYWVFSFLTLSFLYRPLVYNLLDNKHGRRISLVLIPFYIIIYSVFNLHYQKSNFITQESTKTSNSSISNGRNYEDLIQSNDNIFMGKFFIQSKVIDKPYLKLFVPLNKVIEDSLINFNPSLKPAKDKRGLHFQSEISISIRNKKDPSFSDEYLATFEKYYRFSIDSTTFKTDFVIANVNDQLGFESYIGIRDLPEGKHTISFQRLKHKNVDSLETIRKVPFWYFNN